MKNDKHILNILEYASLGLSLSGLAAAIITQKITFAIIPLMLNLPLSTLNNKIFQKQIKEEFFIELASQEKKYLERNFTSSQNYTQIANLNSIINTITKLENTVNSNVSKIIILENKIVKLENTVNSNVSKIIILENKIVKLENTVNSNFEKILKNIVTELKENFNSNAGKNVENVENMFIELEKKFNSDIGKILG